MSKPIVKAHFHGGPNDGHSEFVAREVLERELLPAAVMTLDRKHIHIYKARIPLAPETDEIHVYYAGVTFKRVLAEVVELDDEGEL